MKAARTSIGVGLVVFGAMVLTAGATHARFGALLPQLAPQCPLIEAKLECHFKKGQLVCGREKKDLGDKPGGQQQNDKVQPAEVGGTNQHSCPPGHIVLAQPNEQGSFCEPVTVEDEHSCGEGYVALDKPNKYGALCEPIGGFPAPDAAQAGGERSCGEGYVALDKPNKYGALCEPIGGFPAPDAAEGVGEPAQGGDAAPAQ